MNIRTLFCFLILSLTPDAYATKPCLPSECMVPNGEFDAKLCYSKADWIAEGHVNVISEQDRRHPLNTKFYTFMLIPEHVTKGVLPDYKLVFKTGWCSNMWAGNLSTGQKIKVYGLNTKDRITQQGSFLHYEVIEPR